MFLPGESPWTEEPGGLQSMGSQRVSHDWTTKHKIVVGAPVSSFRLLNGGVTWHFLESIVGCLHLERDLCVCVCTAPAADKGSVVSDSLQPRGLYYKGLKPPMYFMCLHGLRLSKKTKTYMPTKRNYEHASSALGKKRRGREAYFSYVGKS